MSGLIRALSLVLVLGLAVAVMAAEDAASTKDGVIKSVDAKAKTFALEREPRALTFTVNDKTAITLDGKASTFEAAIKADLKATVTYARSGSDRIASKVEVKSATEKK